MAQEDRSYSIAYQLYGNGPLSEVYKNLDMLTDIDRKLEAVGKILYFAESDIQTEQIDDWMADLEDKADFIHAKIEDNLVEASNEISKQNTRTISGEYDSLSVFLGYISYLAQVGREIQQVSNLKDMSETIAVGVLSLLPGVPIIHRPDSLHPRAMVIGDKYPSLSIRYIDAFDQSIDNYSGISITFLGKVAVRMVDKPRVIKVNPNTFLRGSMVIGSNAINNYLDDLDSQSSNNPNFDYRISTLISDLGMLYQPKDKHYDDELMGEINLFHS
jgi:hypothetical protein